MKSLLFYLKRAPPKDDDLLLTTWNRIKEDYLQRFYPDDKFRFPLTLPIDDDLWFEIVRSVKRSASPGVPYLNEYKTNGDFLDVSEEEIRSIVDERLLNRLNYDFSKYDTLNSEERFEEAKRVIDLGLIDPVRLFVKNEPTKTNKEARIINSVSLVDSVCQRVTTLRRASKWISFWLNGVSSAGIQLKDQEAMVDFRKKTAEFLGDDVENSDIQGFEYSFGKACHKMALDIETYMACGETNPRELTTEIKLLRAEYFLSTLPRIVVTSDGSVFEVDQVWLQSGKFTTSFAGTHVRSALVSVAASLDSEVSILVPAKSNGDDCLNSFVGDLAKNYLRIGYKVTDNFVSHGSQPWSFCSHFITEKSHYPESYTKTLLSLLRHKELFKNEAITEELMGQFEFANRARPDWKEFYDFLRTHFPGIN